MVLTKQWLWEDDESPEQGTKKIMEGELPPMPEDLSVSSHDAAADAAAKALLRAIYRLCWVYDPDKRASAEEVANYLKEKLKSIKPNEFGQDGRHSNIRVKLPPMLSNVLDLDDDYDPKMSLLLK